MRQYIYISTAHGLDQADVDDILASCQRNNAVHDVTGLLLYNGRNFLQLLEGDKDDLRWVMQRISSDPRHAGISGLYDAPAEERACPDWRMRRVQIADSIGDRREQIERDLPAAITGVARQLIVNFAMLN
jgi:hypothetical protein